MSFLLSFLSIILHLVGLYLLLNVLYLLFFALAGHRKQQTFPKSKVAQATIFRRMCVLIPAYHSDAVILETAPAAQRQVYSGQVEVHVIADGLLPTTVEALRSQNIRVIEVTFEKSTKGKALLAALQSISATSFDIAVVLDVDNVMGSDFLSQVNDAFAAGYRVVQGHRTAKNLDSAFAVLDACNEEINNHIFRQGHASLGMSAALIGSGMAFDYQYFKQLMQDIGDTPGEDKEMDFRIVKNRIKIGYLPRAYVYDEKIPNSQAFTTQRTRWIAAQLEFLQKYFWEGPVQLWRGNVEFFDKVLQTLLVPRILLLGLLSLLVLISLIGLPFGPAPQFWIALLIGTGGALLLSLPAHLYNRKVAQAILHLPLALVSMVLALLQIKKAKASFMPTPHVASGMDTPQS
jgi:cellulose synthase/poly-beta-1,6-N-acetylglucosamine synthase-like glycosyltransferase